MFIHLGGDMIIRSKDVVAILDETSHASSKDTARFMDSRQNSQVVEIAEDYTKSVVVTHDKVYLSPISSLTLKRRAQVISEIEDFSEE